VKYSLIYGQMTHYFRVNFTPVRSLGRSFVQRWIPHSHLWWTV